MGNKKILIIDLLISLLLFILWDLGILNPILWTSLLLITVMIDTFKI